MTIRLQFGGAPEALEDRAFFRAGFDDALEQRVDAVNHQNGVSGGFNSARGYLIEVTPHLFFGAAELPQVARSPQWSASCAVEKSAARSIFDAARLILCPRTG